MTYLAPMMVITRFLYRFEGGGPDEDLKALG